MSMILTGLLSYSMDRGWDSYAEHLLALFRQLWTSMAIVLLILVLMGILVRVLQGSAFMSVGGSQVVASTLIAIIGLLAIGLFAFLVVPPIASMGVQTVQENVPGIASSAALATRFTTATAMVLGAIGALRMIRAIVEGVVGVAMGGTGSMSRAVIIVMETLVGMLLVSVIVPILNFLIQ